MNNTQPLSPAGRSEALARLADEELDVLVIGGGVVGAGCALDAVTRGLKVGLVEARDYAAGTSSRSSKLFHGGLRYLEQFNFALVFEALKERSLALNTLCPHLARPVPFIYPLQKVIDRGYVGLGIGVYDVMGAGRGVPAHLKHLGRKKTMESFPSGKRSVIRGAIRFYEGQIDDARHTMMISRTAASYGALCVNSTRVTGFVREEDRVVGVTVKDLEAGQEFIIPWGSHGIIGTTDTDWNLDLAHPAASQSDIDYLLGQANTLLQDPLTPKDVVGVYAGLRPLLFGESDSTSTLSREHAVSSPVRGLTVIAGGKYTTYRVMAKDAVDSAVHGLERAVPKSCTERVPLAGADGYFGAFNSRQLIADRTGLHVSKIEHLLGRYGSLSSEQMLDLG